MSGSQVRRALARAARGAVLDRAEIEALLTAGGEDAVEVRRLAGEVRDLGLRAAGRPGVVTYSPKVFVPLTRLCRDRCHYCTFATSPAELRRSGQDMLLGLEEVVEIARAGAAAGCSEALLTLGDRPEDRWPAAAEWLQQRGYDSTLDYVRAAAVAILENTGLLPHLNPGVLGWADLQRLRPVAPSMGMMLETSSRRLFETPGLVHHGSPDKDPEIRLRVLQDAGRAGVPFTTGLLIGIGETIAETADALVRLRSVEREFHGLQEVIIQNFRAKPRTAMASAADCPDDAYLAVVAVARLVLGSAVRIQAPPNLSSPQALSDLLAAGVDDWGGISPVTPDHVNPERPWPQIDDLAGWTAEAGFTLRPRLAIHPEFLARGDAWLDPRLRPFVEPLADADGLRGPAVPAGRPWQEPADYAQFAAGGAGRTDLAQTIDVRGRDSRARSDFEVAFGDWEALSRPEGGGAAPDTGLVAEALRLAESEPSALAHPDQEHLAVALFGAEGDQLTALLRLADDVRRDRVGDTVTYVVNRNINFTNVCYTGCRFCAFAQRERDADSFTLSPEEIADRVREARGAGATEICMQGGIHPGMPGTAYFDLARTVKAAADIHLHAFSPMEIVNGATRAGLPVREWLLAARDAGVDSIPGTAAEILDDDIRWILTKGKLPAGAWLDVVRTAHEVGLPSSATMMYGHVDAPVHWVGHLRTLRTLQEQTGGFTEFVGLPFVHHNAPLYLAGVARPGSTAREDALVTAMARLMLDGAVPNIQVSWVKLGPQGAAGLLRCGANDLGGTLMEETISRMAGSAHGSALSVEQLRGIAALAGRPARQRTTLYGHVPAAV